MKDRLGKEIVSPLDSLPPLFSVMTFRVQISGDVEVDRERFRKSYEDAERFMFGDPESARDYIAIPSAMLESEESLRQLNNASL